MGYDVYGKVLDEPGRYFRNNIWWWHDLWDFCCQVSPDAAMVKYGHSNDGDGLDAEASVRLADALKEAIDTGAALRYETELAQRHLTIPDETCYLCHGKGHREDEIVKQHPKLGEPGGCNACSGKGTVRPFETSYQFSVENVIEFEKFCRASGGFEIW